MSRVLKGGVFPLNSNEPIGLFLRSSFHSLTISSAVTPSFALSFPLPKSAYLFPGGQSGRPCLGRFGCLPRSMKFPAYEGFTKPTGEFPGQDIAEYAVMLAVIVVLVVGTIRLVGSNANNALSAVASSIQ